MAKSIDSQVLMTTVMGVVEQTLAKMSGIMPTEAPQTKEADIIEFYGRMRVMNMNDFNAPVYVSVVNYYLTQEDMNKGKAKGVLVLYVDAENASKLYKFLGFTVPDDEDDESMLDGCGELCNLIGGALKNELANVGYVNLVMSAPEYYKNSVTDGVKFSLDQKKKYQFSFFYWKRKTLVLEVSMADIPLKK